MTEEKARIPNPGSPEAVKMGCRCPVLDNGHGWGSMYGEGTFWIVQNCPVHSVQYAAIVQSKEEE